MQQQPNQVQEPDYYVVLPAEFNAMLQVIAGLPYTQVAGLLNQVQRNIRPMMGEPPEIKMAGPGGRVVGAPPMPGGNGVDPDADADAGQTE